MRELVQQLRGRGSSAWLTLWLLAAVLLVTLSACAVSREPTVLPTPDSALTGSPVTVLPSEHPPVSESPESPAHTEVPVPSEIPTAIPDTPQPTPESAAEVSALVQTPPPSPNAAPTSAVPETASASETEPEPTPTPEAATITLTIKGPDGVLLEDEPVPYTEGMTAEDALQAVCEAQGLALDVRSSGTKRAYVLSIGGFAEKDRGAGSGWVYLHNGVQTPTGVGVLKPAEGDSLSFCYTLDWGADVI